MGVFNGMPHLDRTLASILAQQDVDLELIVVDDGSTDGSATVLGRYAAADARVQPVCREHEGLTPALEHGCRLARGTYIARHDADDLSAPDRLRSQIDELSDASSISLVTCWVDYIGPDDEALGSWTPSESPDMLRDNLRARDVSQLQSIVHGTAVFRRADYTRVGGYRRAFRVAQDIDLWQRLTDVGGVACVRRVLYQRRITPTSLSTRHAGEQRALAALALDMTRLREAGEPEAELLRRAESIRHRTRLSDSSGYYFIGKCLLDRRDRRAAAYLTQALRRQWTSPRIWAAWLLAHGMAVLRGSRH
jgi:glycosyltransferase involved in cell wall biosynthesis